MKPPKNGTHLIWTGIGIFCHQFRYFPNFPRSIFAANVQIRRSDAATVLVSATSPFISGTANLAHPCILCLKAIECTRLSRSAVWAMLVSPFIASWPTIRFFWLEGIIHTENLRRIGSLDNDRKCTSSKHMWFPAFFPKPTQWQLKKQAEPSPSKDLFTACGSGQCQLCVPWRPEKLITKLWAQYHLPTS
jgi:hypothetical protein